jgi:lysophospholipase L1-like esterase
MKRAALWVAAVLLLGEGAVRSVAWLRDREAGGAAAPPGARVVYCIGDSFTYGQGVEAHEAWPLVLARMLREGGGEDLHVRPQAAPGRSSSVAVDLVAKAIRAGDARLILVLAGWNANDGDFAAHAADRAAPIPWAVRVDVALERSRLYRVAKHALTVRDRTLVMDGVPVVPQSTAMSLYDFRAYQEIAEKNLRRIARMCRAAGLPCALLTYPHTELPPNPYTRSEYYHAMFGRTPLAEADYLVADRRPGEIAIDAVIRRVGETEGVPVIDLQPAFARAAGSALFLPDLHHPTAAGHALIARTVRETMRSLLR